MRKVTIPTTTIKSGDWSDPTVWSKGKIPDGVTQVTINNSITVDINATSYSVDVTKNGSVRVNPGKSLNITGH